MSDSKSECEILFYQYDSYIENNYPLFNSGDFYPKEESKKKSKSKYFICNNCYSSPKFSFTFYNLLNIKCDCKKVINIRTNDFIARYTDNGKTMVEKYCNCKEHHNSAFKFYCFDCKINLCDNCLNKKKTHKNHSLQYLLIIDDKINEIQQLIKIIRKKLPIGDRDFREDLNLIEALINKYKEYPSHNLYESIFKAKEFLSNLFIPNIFENIKIRTKEELEENKKKSYLISSIKINYQNFNDLSLFEKLNLVNLEKLQLRGNGITNIEPIINCNVEKLKYLGLEDNKLNDESLKNFDKLNFKNIRYINLCKNEIKSPKIFEAINNYPTLKTLFLGENPFDEKELDKYKNKTLHLNHLIKIGLTGSFSDKTIHFLSNLKFSELKTMYISRNNLSSLSFLENVFCENLVSFWAINNNLTNYDDILKLPFKEKINKINLKGNKINNIDNLLDFIKHFPNLKELILLDNPINKEIQKYKK